MAEPKAAPPASATETEITLGLLNAVHDNSAVTQRSVAADSASRSVSPTPISSAA